MISSVVTRSVKVVSRFTILLLVCDGRRCTAEGGGGSDGEEAEVEATAEEPDGSSCGGSSCGSSSEFAPCLIAPL